MESWLKNYPRISHFEKYGVGRASLSGFACATDGLLFYPCHPPELGMAFGPNDKEGLAEMDLIEPGEIEVTTIHDVERTRFGEQVIEDVDVMNFPISDECDSGDASSQIEQGVELDCRFRLAEVCPGNRDRHKSMVVESSA